MVLRYSLTGMRVELAMETVSRKTAGMARIVRPLGGEDEDA
jgi:hypothetical protein